MRAATRERLLELSARFYERHGNSFDATRGRPWPGWERLWQGPRPGNGLRDEVPPDRPFRCLDAGCGNGRFGLFLQQRVPTLHYLGVDTDAGLLEAARQALATSPETSLGPSLGPAPTAEVRQADLTRSDPAGWTAPNSQDLVALFGVLHHVPDEAARRGLLRRLSGCLAPGGRLAASIWRLDQDPERLERKRVPWDEWNAGRSPHERVDVDDLDPGDTLLGWRGDRSTPRYCHFPTEREIERLADLGDEAPLVDRFEADGPTGRDNLYLVWRRPHELAASGAG